MAVWGGDGQRCLTRPADLPLGETLSLCFISPSVVDLDFILVRMRLTDLTVARGYQRETSG